MVENYPHTLTYASAGTPSVYNEATGTYSPAVPGSEVVVDCRARPSKVNTERPSQDGTITKCSFDLGFPKGIDPIPEGAVCIIKGVRGEVLISAPLIDYQEGNISIRGWI